MVDDLITVSVTPPESIETSIVVLDMSVPTGLAPLSESFETLVNDNARVQQSDVSGRKIILYIEDMPPGESLYFPFQARALYPMRANAVTSQVYFLYNPERKAKTTGGDMAVVS